MNGSLDDLKKNATLSALNKTKWNYRSAAKLLGVSKQGVHQMAKRYGLIKQRTVRLKRWVRA